MSFPSTDVKPFPVADAVPSYWRKQVGPIDNHRSTEHLPAQADVVIIGAGYAGASIVHHIIEECMRCDRPIPSILILEAREACSGATGRNGTYHMLLRSNFNLARTESEGLGGHLKPDPLSRAASVLETHGKAVAEHVATFEARQVDAIKELVRQKAVSMGVNLQTNTPVSSVSAADESTKDRWVVNTSCGSVETSTLVYATNGYTSALVPEMKEKVVPVRGIVARLAGENAPKMTDSYMMRFSDYEYDYMIPRPDGSIVVGGGRRDYYKDLDEWFDVSDDSRLMDGARNYFDGYMQRHFRGWENSDVRTEDVWTGIMGYSNDGFPYVGPICGKPGQYMCAGFSGHGMPQIFFCAKAVASMVITGDAEDVDLPVPYRITRSRWYQPKEHVSLKMWQQIAESQPAQARL
ncbi:unnamed protein product [Alternaria alternata]